MRTDRKKKDTVAVANKYNLRKSGVSKWLHTDSVHFIP